MTAEGLLTVAYVVWAVVTVVIYLVYRSRAGVGCAEWRQIAEERRQLWAARRILERDELDRRYPDALAEVADYLGEDARRATTAR